MNNNQGLESVKRLLSQSDFNKARQQCLELCNTVLSNNAEAWQVLSGIYLQTGDPASAESASRHSIHINTGNAIPHLYLGIALFLQNKADKAIDALNCALTRNPNLKDAYVHLYRCYNHIGLTSNAVESLENAHVFFPEDMDISCLLADAYEMSNSVKESRNLLDPILGTAPLHPVANIVYARLCIRDGDYSAAVNRLNSLLENTSPGAINQINTYYLLGKAYDRVGKYKQAFSAYDTANKASLSLHTNRYNGAIFLDSIYRYKAAITCYNVQSWTIPNDNIENEPVFLIGFPRSGTTLTEQLLATHPDIETSNERQLIQQTHDFLMSGNDKTGFPYILNNLSTKKVEELRNHYMKTAHTDPHNSNNAKVFIDKMPLNIVEIGFIKRIFRNPRFILLLRDPRDVCLSCFMQSFILNNAMANFLTLENTARLYAATMDLWLYYKEVFNLDVYELKYEHLISDTKTVISGLIDFLGLEWTDRILDQEERETRVVCTPSYQEITAPIYSSSVNKWHNYKDQLTIIEPTLAPYIEEFDYQPTSGQ